MWNKRTNADIETSGYRSRDVSIIEGFLSRVVSGCGSTSVGGPPAPAREGCGDARARDGTCASRSSRSKNVIGMCEWNRLNTIGVPGDGHGPVSLQRHPANADSAG